MVAVKATEYGYNASQTRLKLDSLCQTVCFFKINNAHFSLVVLHVKHFVLNFKIKHTQQEFLATGFTIIYFMSTWLFTTPFFGAYPTTFFFGIFIAQTIKVTWSFKFCSNIHVNLYWSVTYTHLANKSFFQWIFLFRKRSLENWSFLHKFLAL